MFGSFKCPTQDKEVLATIFIYKCKWRNKNLILFVFLNDAEQYVKLLSNKKAIRTCKGFTIIQITFLDYLGQKTNKQI